MNDSDQIQQEQDLVGSYFLELWRLKSNRTTNSHEDEEPKDEEESVLTELDILNSFGDFRRTFGDYGVGNLCMLLRISLKNKEGLRYNPYFLGGAIAMPKMLNDGAVEYEDGTPAKRFGFNDFPNIS
ncbi:hypothetical protein L1987_54652 [Smallanthus sonchifolius]|uniref:Uncharacterized protein n=1 Tax=Smallanthus sonchifolius TaxID=185202 RepID=A0ACB9E7L2_9ASTR|nr:hypothetical protein L1987_54652 [Smallanthus sonchifolius]